MSPEHELTGDELDCVSGAGVGGEAFGVLMQAAKSSPSDLATIMDGVQLINQEKGMLRVQMDAINLARATSDEKLRSRQVSLARLAPSRVTGIPDKMAVLTLGGGYGATIKSGWQGEQGESPHGKAGKRQQYRQDLANR